MSMIKSEIKKGNSKQVGDFELTPMNQVFKFQIPGYHAGWIWNRPKAVVVRTSDGKERILPVNDVTRIAIWSLLASGLLGAILMGLLSRVR
jgi:hypothetical protein